jgi:hypothetical protein
MESWETSEVKRIIFRTFSCSKILKKTMDYQCELRVKFYCRFWAKFSTFLEILFSANFKNAEILKV